jgi:hypothetical protein
VDVPRFDMSVRDVVVRKREVTALKIAAFNPIGSAAGGHGPWSPVGLAAGHSWWTCHPLHHKTTHRTIALRPPTSTPEHQPSRVSLPRRCLRRRNEHVEHSVWWRSGCQQEEARCGQKLNSIATRASQYAGEEGSPSSETNRRPDSYCKAECRNKQER